MTFDTYTNSLILNPRFLRGVRNSTSSWQMEIGVGTSRHVMHFAYLRVNHCIPSQDFKTYQAMPSVTKSCQCRLHQQPNSYDPSWRSARLRSWGWNYAFQSREWPCAFWEIKPRFPKYCIFNNLLSKSRLICIQVTATTSTSQLAWCFTFELPKKDRYELGKNIIYIRDGEVIVRSKELSAKPFKKLTSDKSLSYGNEFMTLDIETVHIDNSMKPYLICGYNPSHFISSRIVDVTDLNQRFKLIKDVMDQLYNIPKVKYVYAHNLSNFDGIFLLKYLLKIRYSSHSLRNRW